MVRKDKKILSKQFTKTSFRLPQVSTQLAQRYNYKPQSWWQQSRLKIIGIFFLIVIIGLVYSPIFKIKNIIINNVSSGATRQQIFELLNNYIHQPKFYVLPQDNLLLFSPEAATRSLSNKLYVAGIEFDRHWPNVLRVTLQPDLIAGIYKIDDKIYTLDKRGVIVQQLQPEQIEANLIIIENNDIKSASIGQQIVEEKIINFISDLMGECKINDIGVKIDKVTITNKDLPTLYVLTSEGWRFLVSMQSSAHEQILNLKKLLTGKIKDDQNKLDYVDVRFGNKLFYKLK
ncbi:MAG: hypothetical protein V1712_01335 [Patescibacteria group bacterium]